MRRRRSQETCDGDGKDGDGNGGGLRSGFKITEVEGFSEGFDA